MSSTAVTSAGRRETALGEAREEAARLALGCLPGVERPEQVVAEDRQQRRGEREPGDERHRDRDGDAGPHRGDHLEVADAHREHAHDDGAGAGGDDRADPAHGGPRGIVPVAAARDLLAVAADEEDRVVGADAEHHHDEERGEGGADLPAGRGEEAEDAGRDDERAADRDQRDERRERRAVDREQDDDDEDDRHHRRAVGADLDRLEVVGADRGGARDVGLEAGRRRRDEMLAELLHDGRRLVARVGDVEVDDEDLERAVLAPEQRLELGAGVGGLGLGDRGPAARRVPRRSSPTRRTRRDTRGPRPSGRRRGGG